MQRENFVIIINVKLQQLVLAISKKLVGWYLVDFNGGICVNNTTFWALSNSVQGRVQHFNSVTIYRLKELHDITLSLITNP